MTSSDASDLPKPLYFRRCGTADRDEMLAIINMAAKAYRGVIPPDRWQNPYMPADELTTEINDGVVFCGAWAEDRLIGVMGVQRRSNVDLIRHAYVDPECQGHGVGAALLSQLRQEADRPILIGTWRAAEWAIRFYQRHGFSLVQEEYIAPLLRCYWNVPDRQIATSVVLSDAPLQGRAASELIAAAV